jgi:hypothetical protein
VTHLIRTTMQPHLRVEVGDAEYLDLQRQGLLIEDPAPMTPALAPAAKKAAPSALTKEG